MGCGGAGGEIELKIGERVYSLDLKGAYFFAGTYQGSSSFVRKSKLLVGESRLIEIYELPTDAFELVRVSGDIRGELVEGVRYSHRLIMGDDSEYESLESLIKEAEEAGR
ncbi:MAG: hypothetical protein AABW79_02855 [Nanoarchaeota archaeon]